MRNSAIPLIDVEKDEENAEMELNSFFSKDACFDAMSRFIIARDLRLSAGIVSEIDSIEMEEGFIY